MSDKFREETITVIANSYSNENERKAFLDGIEFADSNPKSHYNLSSTDVLRSQVQTILNDAERMTSGNFAHHINSIKLMARCALRNFQEVEE